MVVTSAKRIFIRQSILRKDKLQHLYKWMQQLCSWQMIQFAYNFFQCNIYANIWLYISYYLLPITPVNTENNVPYHHVEQMDIKILIFQNFHCKRTVKKFLKFWINCLGVSLDFSVIPQPQYIIRKRIYYTICICLATNLVHEYSIKIECSSYRLYKLCLLATQSIQKLYCIYVTVGQTNKW